jgi:eukaryotic-like serine/threonine-protein kinase
MPSDPQRRYQVAAYRGDAAFAFVSYSHDDTASVFPELEALAAEGVHLYYDEGIHPGHTWDDELARAIERCSVFVFFVTRRSATSQNCRREVAFAIDHDKPIIAVHLEDVELPAGLRLSIGNRQAIVRARFDEARYRERLITAVREHVGSEPRGIAADRTAPVVSQPGASTASRSRRWGATMLAVVVVAGVGVGVAYWRHIEATHAARATRIAQVEGLIQQDQYGAAFALAQPMIADNESQADPKLQAMWKEIVLPGTPLVAESGATLSYKAYDETNGGWIVAGRTPIERMLDLPKGVVRIKIEKPGFKTGEFAVANPGPSLRSEKSLENDFLKGFVARDLPLAIAPDGKIANDMVLVPATDEPMYLTGLPDDTTGFDLRSLPEFAMSKFEVTNREYKEFVDAGGYDNPTYWDGLQFRDEGRTLDWTEARTRFVDRTSRPGPAGWELSSYPAGEAELPVGGVSWYEAVAYARFRHLSLPTIHHWVRAAFGPDEGQFETAPTVAAASQFLANGPIEAHSKRGLGPWGTVNMAGNAREWVWNTVGDQPAALGGAWSDYREEYQSLVTLRPMSRSPDLGMRLMQSFGPIPNELLAALPRPVDEAYAKREPLSDEAFSTLRYQFSVGPRTPSAVHVEEFAQTDTWTAQEVQLTFAQDDVLTIYVLLPRARHGPLQAVLYGTPSLFETQHSNRDVLEQLRTADVVVLGGRALVIPIWPGLYQRGEQFTTDLQVMTDVFRRRPLQYFKDGVRTIDYLATRNDIDAQHIGFMGTSAGAIFVAPSILTMDGRIRAAVLASAGVWIWPLPAAPAMDIVHYAPRIHVPTLMINGRYDSVLPYELSQRRLFDLLGTPSADKRQVLFDVSHFTFPHSQLAKEVNDWFDKYLGPVK